MNSEAFSFKANIKVCGAKRFYIHAYSMFTHLENDLCRTIFLHIYLIYVKNASQLSALANSFLYFPLYRAGRGVGDANDIHLEFQLVFNLLCTLSHSLPLHELNAICIHFHGKSRAGKAYTSVRV